MKNGFFGLLLLSLLSCDLGTTSNNETASKDVRKLPPKMEYSYTCLKDTGKISAILDRAGKIINTVATFNIEVTDQEQMRFGDTFLIEAQKDKNFSIDNRSPLNTKLQTILDNLVQSRIKPSGIEYAIFLLDDTATINAYTVGGKIFITKAMMNKCENDDQLYAIIGHEIGHNEKGHIKNAMKQLKASNRFFGEWGGSFFTIKKVLTGSFNHKNELEADYYGLDLTWKLGYDICAIRQFWDAMAQGEGKERYAILDFLRTHPYSDTRSSCLVNHISRNFKQECE